MLRSHLFLSSQINEVYLKLVDFSICIKSYLDMTFLNWQFSKQNGELKWREYGVIYTKKASPKEHFKNVYSAS